MLRAGCPDGLLRLQFAYYLAARAVPSSTPRPAASVRQVSPRRAAPMHRRSSPAQLQATPRVREEQRLLLDQIHCGDGRIIALHSPIRGVTIADLPARDRSSPTPREPALAPSVAS